MRLPSRLAPSVLLVGLPLIGLLLVGCAPPDPPPSSAPDTTAVETPALGPAPAPPRDRRVTALSDREIEGYLAGRGMGLAVPAERNHFPGPLHVLDLRDTLGLSPAQQAYAEQLRQQVGEQAPRLGEAYIAAERALDSLFVHQVATEANVRRASRAVADVLGDLRALHLVAHIAMRDTLRPDQVGLYDEMRGYPADTTGQTAE
ncbi:MAG: hypothetical protein AAGG50_10170 [Bacteroidota bacterium]